MSDQEQVLRTGVLFKKGSGAGPFGRRNWKPRYFVLTASKLQYYTFEDGDLKGEVDLRGCDENVLEVMPADSMKTGSSASTIWRVAINTPSRRLLVAAGTEMEMNDWVDKLVLAFRIGAGLQPMPNEQVARASVYAPADARVVVGQGGITDFQNFAAARRSVAVGMNRHSVGSHPGSAHSGGAGDVGRHSDVDGVLLMQAEQLHEQQQRQREQEALAARQREEETMAERQREEEEARGRVMEAEAAAAAALTAAAADEERREREEAERLERERLEQQQREEQQRLEQERLERERVERLAQEEARKQAVQEKLLADELAMTQSFKKTEQQEALLELQRRQKREEHERQRRESVQKAMEAAALAAKQEADLHARQQELALADEDPLERQRREKREKRERERAERERLALEQEQQKQQQQSDFDDLEFRMTAQLQQSQQQFFDNDNESDSDSDEGYTVGMNSVHGGRPSEPERSPPLVAQPERLSSPSSVPPPRSSLIGDVKVETMRKQQAEHQRRREQSLQQEKFKHEMEQQRAQLEAVALSQQHQHQQHHEQQHDVTIARGSERGEIEIVRRPMKPASNSPPAPRVMESVEF